jgi:hypothetical protein
MACLRLTTIRGGDILIPPKRIVSVKKVWGHPEYCELLLESMGSNIYVNVQESLNTIQAKLDIALEEEAD